MSDFDRMVRAGLNGNAHQPPVVMAQPINDVQMVALIAAQMGQYDDVQDRVSDAIDLLAESLAQMHPELRQAAKQPPGSIVGRAQAKLAIRETNT